MTVAATKGFEPTRISPSRVNALLSCGIAFRMKYVEGLPEEVSGSAALYGSVAHLMLENYAKDRSQDALTLMREAWLTFTADRSKTLHDFIVAYQSLSTKAIRLEHEIKTRRPDIKAVRMTKDWKSSSIHKEIEALVRKWKPRLDKDSPYRFTDRDPLPALYDESLPAAKRYEARWGHLPNSWFAELELNEEWRGFNLNGFVDSIEPLLDKDSKELVGVGVIDYKTYRYPPAEFKDWRQVVIYDAAIRSLIERGGLTLPVSLDEVPLYVGVDYFRWDKAWEDDNGKPFPARRFWKVGEADYDRLERELKAYADTVERGNFLPAEKGRNPDFCGYPENCCLRSCSAAGGSSEPVEVSI